MLLSRFFHFRQPTRWQLLCFGISAVSVILILASFVYIPSVNDRPSSPWGSRNPSLNHGSLDGSLCVMVDLEGGLANRIRTVTGFVGVGAYLGLGRIEFRWRAHGDCPGVFHDYFQDPEPLLNVDVRSVPPNRPFSSSLLSDPTCFHFNGFSYFDLVYKHIFNSEPDMSSLPFDLFSISRSLFQPNARIESLLSDFRRRVSWSSTRIVGLHIRRTDMVDHIDKRGLRSQAETFEDFKTFIRSELKSDSSTRFFLATDNLESRTELVSIFGSDRILYYDSPFDTSLNRQTTLEHAVIDLFLLSSTEKFMPSFFSTFSELAEGWRSIQ